MTEPNELRLSAVLPAPLSAVHAALTDAAALRVWLAEHAEVALPDRYEFWGRYTPDGAAPHQRLLHADEHSLRFAWTVDGVESTVELTLTETEDAGQPATLLTLTQTGIPTFAEVVSDAAGVRGALQSFWSLSIANLSDYLTDRELTPKCDFTSPHLRGSVEIDATPDAVFESLTRTEQFCQWSGANVGIEPYVGGRFSMGGFELDPDGARFIEFEAPRRAAVQFPDGLVTTWELEGSQGRTRLTFVQSGFDLDNPPYPGWAGWLDGISRLRRYHEVPGMRTIWRQFEVPGVPAGILINEA